MRRRLIGVMVIATVALLAAVAAVPVAAHMGVGFGATNSVQSSGTTISMADAKASFTQYLQQQGYDNLAISEVMQFSNQFYAEAIDATTGAGALELVMSLNGQAIHPEPGPMMMWNTAYSPMLGTNGGALRQGMMNGSGGYGMMGGSGGSGMMSGGRGYGMMGNASGTYGPGMMGTGSGMMGYHPETATTLAQPLTAATALTTVQAWLTTNRPGVTATDATAFPGYFTFHTEQNGKITGMLSVQSSTGAIWEHVWHGDFVAMDPAS